jgi:hypothetical protein
MDLPNALAEADRFPGSPDNSMDYAAVERYLAVVGGRLMENRDLPANSTKVAITAAKQALEKSDLVDCIPVPKTPS